jgi:hypothetical protein
VLPSFCLVVIAGNNARPAESKSVTYSYSASEGQSGHVDFIPKMMCTAGQFTGSCAEGITTGSDGTVCAPAFLADGSLDGETLFVQVF